MSTVRGGSDGRASSGPGVRLLVCGARDYDDAPRLHSVLDAYTREHPVAVLIEGEAPGADTLARAWAHARGVPVAAYPADQRLEHRQASAARNSRMLREGRPDQVIAFVTTTLQASSGTHDMVRKAKAAGVSTVVIDPVP